MSGNSLYNCRLYDFFKSCIMRHERRGNRLFGYSHFLSSCPSSNIPQITVSDDPNWLAIDEMVLITALEFYNYGNWELHAEILLTERDKSFYPQVVRDHCISVYMDLKKKLGVKEEKNLQVKYVLKDHCEFLPLDILDIMDNNDYQNIPQAFLEILGYMPITADFREEYSPSAEDIIGDLHFNQVDDYNKNLHLILLDGYRNKVKERVKIKQAVKNFSLIEKYYESEIYANSYLDPSQEERYYYVDSESMKIYEERLCHALYLNPRSYDVYKAHLIEHEIRKMSGEFTGDVYMPPDMTVSQCLLIYEFLHKTGYIRTKNLLSYIE